MWLVCKEMAVRQREGIRGMEGIRSDKVEVVAQEVNRLRVEIAPITDWPGQHLKKPRHHFSWI